MCRPLKCMPLLSCESTSYSCFNEKEHGSNVDTQTTQPTERITVYIVVWCVFLSTLIPYSNAELLE